MATSTELLRTECLVSIQLIYHLLKASFHSHFDIHRYFFSFLVCLPNIICMRVLFRKKNLETRGFNRPFCSCGLIVLALVMSEREVEVNLVLI